MERKYLIIDEFCNHWVQDEISQAELDGIDDGVITVIEIKSPAYIEVYDVTETSKRIPTQTK